MNPLKAVTDKNQIKIGADLITVLGLKGDGSLFRVTINNGFKGYIQVRDGLYHRSDGHTIYDLIFVKICQCLAQGICT